VKSRVRLPGDIISRLRLHQFPSRLGSQQLSIHIKTLLDDFKIFKDYCPRNLFSGSNFSPEKSLQKNLSIFCLENQSCDRRNAGRRTDLRDKKSSDFSGEIFRERNFIQHLLTRTFKYLFTHNFLSFKIFFFRYFFFSDIFFLFVPYDKRYHTQCHKVARRDFYGTIG